MSEWKTPKEGLPVEGQEVLVVVDQQGVSVGNYMPWTKCWECRDCHPDAEVLLWMPIPGYSKKLREVRKEGDV